MRRAAGFCSLGILLILCVSFCFTELAEADLHWHLLAGREILRSGQVPRVDAFSYTSAGRPWVDLHWLFQAVVAGVERRFGWDGLDGLKVALIAGAFGLAAAAAARRGAGAPAIAVVLLPALVASQERFTLRPEAVSLLLLAALLGLLAERRDRPQWLLAVPPLLALWANCHALYAIGVVLVILTCIGDWFEDLRRGSGPWPRASRPMWITTLAGILATILTPFGVGGWSLPRRLLLERIGADTIYARSIAEFQAPFGGYAPTTAITAFAGLTVLVGAAAWFGRRRATLADLLGLAALLSLALLARRNVPLFSVAAVVSGAPLIGEMGRRLVASLPARPPWVAIARRGPVAMAAAVTLVGGALLGEVWSNRFYERDGTQRYFGRGPSPGFYPEGAADFIIGRRPVGEAIHDLATGGYLAWRWYPDRRVFIDGRLEVHDEELFAAYLRMQSDPRVFEDLAARHGARVVVAQYRPEWAALLRHLAGRNGWQPVYVDLAAAVFVRTPAAGNAGDIAPIDPGDPALGLRILAQIREARRRSDRLDPAPDWLRRRLPRRPVPVAETNAALFFGLIGRHANAELLFREALGMAPRNPVLHYDLGQVLEQAGRTTEARAAYEAALEAEAQFAPARVALALRLLRDGDPDGALREWERAERDGMLGGASLRARGAILAGRGRLDEAIEDYRGVVEADPGNLDVRSDLAVLYQRRGLHGPAIEELERLRALDPGGCAAGTLLGRLRAVDGRAADAERILRAAGAAVPGCAAAHRALAIFLGSAGRRDEAAAAVAAALEAGADRAALSSDPTLRMLGVAPAAPAVVPPPPELTDAPGSR